MSLTVVAGGVASGVGIASLLHIIMDTISARNRKPGPRQHSRLFRLLLVPASLLGRCLGERAPKGLSVRLSAAGVGMPARQFMAIKTGSAFIALLWCLVLASHFGSFVVLIPTGLPLFTFFAPDLWLRQRTKQRVQAIEHELGDVLELVRVAIGAGMGVRRALAEVGLHQKGLVASELRRASEQIVLGESYEKAFTALEQRCPTHGMTAFIAALRRAQKHGTPLSQPLTAIIEQVRADYARRTAEVAARAAPKIQLIVALLLVPSVLLLIAATVIPLFLH